MKASIALLPAVVVFCVAGCTNSPNPARPSATAAPAASVMSVSTTTDSSTSSGSLGAHTSADGDKCSLPWLPLDVSPLCNEGYELKFRGDGQCQRCVKINK